jgi:hypothetical protein
MYYQSFFDGTKVLAIRERVRIQSKVSSIILYNIQLLPRAHAQGGKVIGLVVVVVVTPKIGISRDLGTWATRKPNESIGFGEKLASLCFKSKETVHEHKK